MGILNKIFAKNDNVKETIIEMIAEQEQELLKYKIGSPLSRRCKDKINVLKELALRLNINLHN